MQIVKIGHTTQEFLFSQIVRIISHSRIKINKLASKGNVHPQIIEALKFYSPIDLHQLALEFPTVSLDGRLAYTQNDDKLEREIRTVTTVGRYLKRHFPTMPDTAIRNYSTSKNGCMISDKIEDFIRASQAVKTCMSNFRDADSPYHSYAPELGWKIALNFEGDEIIGRALVHEPSKKFVRTFRKDNYGTRSCEILQEYLKSLGYIHGSNWEDGTKILYIDDQVPYIDGDVQTVSRAGSHLIINSNGDKLCNNTDGTYDGQEDRKTCEDCGDRMHEDDAQYTGYSSDRVVCECCVRNYNLAWGRGNSQYLEEEDNTVFFNSEYYVLDYISDYYIYEMDGDYYHIDDLVYCEYTEEYILNESARTCEDGRTMHEEFTWKCSDSGKIYCIDEISDQVTCKDGNIYHIDNFTVEIDGYWYGFNDLILVDNQYILKQGVLECIE